MSPLTKALVLATVMFYAGSASARTLHQAAKTYSTLYHLLSSTPELKHIVRLFNYTNLLPLIKDPDTKITCFFPSSKHSNLTDLIDWDIYHNRTYNRWVWPVLLHHCLDGQTAITLDKLQRKRYRSAFVWRYMDYPDLVHANLQFKITRTGTFIFGEAYNKAKVIKPDLKGGKSIVHVTKGDWFIPEYPPPDSFSDIFDEFLGVIFETGISAKVFGASSLAAELANPTEALTIFAPRDAAFEAFFSKLNVTVETLVANREVVDMIVKMHVLRGRYLYEGALLSYKQGVKLQMVGGPATVTTDMAIFPGRSGLAQFLTISTPYSSAHIGSYDIGGNGNDHIDTPLPAQWVGHFLDDVLLPVSLASIKVKLVRAS